MMSMSSNKRKGRMHPNNNKLGRSKLYSEKNLSCNGIYSNSKVMYAGASLVGCVVQVQVQNGTVYEGVLRTFSHQLDIVLEMAHKVSAGCPPSKGVSQTVGNLIASFPFEGGLHDKIIFKLSDVIMMHASNVDVDYAVKDTFTDTAISKFNGQVKARELEPWEGSESDTPLIFSMDQADGTNGWDANDMFRTNAEKYGVKSSYDNSLQEYTVPLTKKDTAEYKLQEAKALKIAQEIETNSSSQSRIQLEDGDEEDRFSAVHRTNDENTTSKYVLPHKRRHIPALKHQTSTTSSPIHQKAPPSIPKPPFRLAPPKNETSEKSPNADDALVPEVDIQKNIIEPQVPDVPKVEAISAPSLPPRIERRREQEKKMAKQKGRLDEIEDFKKFSKNLNVLTEEKETVEEDTLAVKLERVKVVEKEEEVASNVVKFSTLNPNAKEFIFNPNKTFTPRSTAPAPAPIPAPTYPSPSPHRVSDQASMVAVAPSMLPQPLYMQPPQYVMQAPVSVALTGHYASTNQPPRFRKGNAQPLLTLQYTTPPPSVTSVHHQQNTLQYPQMNFVMGPRVVSPQPVGVIPTSHSVSYCDTSHLIMSASTNPHPGHQHATNHHHHHPPQSQTPVLHPAPSPVHHTQPPPSAAPLLYPTLQSHAAHHSQSMGHHHHHHHPIHFPGGGPQPLMLHHHPMHHAQMTILPTSVAMTPPPTSIATPPYVQHH